MRRTSITKDLWIARFAKSSQLLAQGHIQGMALGTQHADLVEQMLNRYEINRFLHTPNLAEHSFADQPLQPKRANKHKGNRPTVV